MIHRPIAALAALVFSLATARAEFPENSPAFKTDYDAALAAAKESGKPLLVVFSAAWCGPCQANKQNVYPAEPVREFHDRFVWAYLDTDQKKNAEVAKRFGVRGIPHIQFVSSEDEAIDTMIGGTSPRAFVRKLRSVLRSVES